MDYETTTDDTVTWIIVGTVFAILFLMGIAMLVCLYWQRHSNIFRAWLMGIPFLQKHLTVARRDSLDDLEDDRTTQSQNLRQWRREKSQGVIGIKTAERVITQSGTSGFRWKKKWRDRKARSKERRKIKHEERKKRRALKASRSREESSSESETSGSESSKSESSSTQTVLSVGKA